MKKLLLMIVALILAVAACGGGDDTTTGDLPVNTGAEPDTALDSTCLAGEPECQDIPGNEEPQDLPSGDDDGDAVQVVDIAAAADSTGQVIVSGFVVDVAGESRLCEVLAESFPPQCGGESITVTDLSQVDPDSLKTEGDVTWTDEPTMIMGEMVDGTLVATPIDN